MFRIGLLLRTNFGRSPLVGTSKDMSLESFPWKAIQDGDRHMLQELLRSNPEILVADRPQGYLLRHEEQPLAFLRGNGQVFLPEDDQIEVGHLLAAGVGLEEIARGIATRLKRLTHPTKEPPAHATRGIWRTQPILMPEPLAEFGGTWTDAEWERITTGLIPEEMEDKWFVFSSEGRLHLARSWTGHTIYEIGFRRAHEGWTVTDALVTGDESIYARSDDETEQHNVLNLINGLLLGRW